MDEQKTLLKRIVKKIRELKERYEKLESSLIIKEKEITRLQERITELEKQENNKYRYKLNKTLDKGKYQSEKDSDIKNLVRDIDQCLQLLDNRNQYKDKLH